MGNELKQMPIKPLFLYFCEFTFSKLCGESCHFLGFLFSHCIFIPCVVSS